MIAQVKRIGLKVTLAYCFLLVSQSAATSQTMASARQGEGDKSLTGLPSTSKVTDTTLISSLSSTLLVNNTNGVITSLPEKLVKDQFTRMATTIAMPYNSRVKTYISHYTVKNRQFISLMLERKHRFFPIYEEALSRHGLPEELKYLSMVESSLNPRAMSPVKAAGLWQFMSVTGRYYDLRQDAYIDERLDPYKSTDAACRYLKELHDMFGDWHLALAAYNCGPGNVRKAMRYSGNKKSFWQIYEFLPAETRAYVPKFIALNYVMKYADTYNITMNLPVSLVAADTIMVNQYLNMSLFAKQLNITLEELTELNPQYKRSFVPAYGGYYSLSIPANKKQIFTYNRYAILSSSVNNLKKITHETTAGETITKIAQQHNIRVEDLKRWNRLKSNYLPAGQQLTIWVDTTSQLKVYTIATLVDQKATQQVVVNIKTLATPKLSIEDLQPASNLWRVSQAVSNTPAERITRLYRTTTSNLQLAKK
jgi:membrane-bound lytic murein transglycosylase D